jgi:hypothetical protein
LLKSVEKVRFSPLPFSFSSCKLCVKLLRFDDEVQPETGRSRALAPLSRTILFDWLAGRSDPSNRCPRRIKITVLLDAREKTVNVDPDNLLSYQEIK